ncbi:hypothetical protein MN116_003931 [Schistosoma mekongi]|uniref:Intraflagellar transport protein 43 homolog n=1 Tax=Schistosoma mekongi TaxID=38744 RepID=A0AAE2D5Y4_SCHME|nr:hypothetical protein MN116_003931 [Schistosoma mekongi]
MVTLLAVRLSEGISSKKSTHFIHNSFFYRRAHKDIQDVCSTVQKEGSDEELEIPIIPDLINVKDPSLNITGAVAPSVVINKIPSYRELSEDLFGHSTLPLMDNDIDLRVLTKHLCSKSELQENDEAWDWNYLFSELRSLK